MDIFKFAMDKEKYSEFYYRDLASRAGHRGIRNILTMLADEEAKHFETVKQMKAGTPTEVADTPILTDAREIFEKIRAGAETFDFHVSEADLYARAARIEKENKQYYQQKADEATDPAQKEIFVRLAQEEDKHLLLMDRLRSFVSRPESFLENAEMYHFNDYAEGEF